MVGQTSVDVDSILKERGGRYGAYPNQARIAQAIKDVMRDTPSWNKLEPFQKETLDMNANKIARILNGDPNYLDSWVDIGGYNQLTVNELQRREQEDHKRSLASEHEHDPLLGARPRHFPPRPEGATVPPPPVRPSERSRPA